MGNVTSFLLGLGAAWLAPMIARVIRPVAVEAAAAGMGFFDDARRVVAEQIETLEDIAAEARARREDLITAGNGHHEDESVNGDAEAAPAPGRRRGGGSRRRVS